MSNGGGSAERAAFVTERDARTAEPPPLWNTADLARFLGMKPTTVSTMLCRTPERLPPRVQAIASPRWVPAVCQAWAEQHSGRPKNRGGRPRLPV